MPLQMLLLILIVVLGMLFLNVPRNLLFPNVKYLPPTNGHLHVVQTKHCGCNLPPVLKYCPSICLLHNEQTGVKKLTQQSLQYGLPSRLLNLSVPLNL